MYAIGIDVGGTKCAVSFGEDAGGRLSVLDKAVMPTDAFASPQEAMDRFCEESRRLLADHGEPAIQGIGISCGGPLDARAGVVLSPPNLPGWDNVPIAERMRGEFGVPVRLQNDANACALAEWRYGAGKGCRNMVFLTFGTGLGAGLILDGRLYSGANDMAGEAGHIRLAENGPLGYQKAGSFEGFCSGGGIARLAEYLQDTETTSAHSPLFSGQEPITARRIAELADQGDAFCRRVYAVSGEYLGRGLSILIDLLNPEKIVIGSIFARSSHLLWESAEAVIEQEALPISARVCQVVPAALGEAIGDFAALSLAFESFE